MQFSIFEHHVARLSNIISSSPPPLPPAGGLRPLMSSQGLLALLDRAIALIDDEETTDSLY
jgi:hypothetical protein